MTITLTPKMKFALQVALDELENSGEWEEHLTEKEVESVFEGVDQLREALG